MEHRFDRPRSCPASVFRLRPIAGACLWLFAGGVLAQAQLDPVANNVPKYVIPLVIPPEMPTGSQLTEPCPPGATCPHTHDNIAVRQFRQQILPGGVWNAVNGRADAFGATTVWGYGPAGDPIPMGLTLNGVQVQPPGVAPVPAASSSFNYPSFTLENRVGQMRSVRWINELVALDTATGKPYPLADKRRTFLPHLLAVDRTLHFANPERLACADPTTGARLPGATNCRPYVAPAQPDPRLGQPYNGPVPMVVHVHGGEASPYSDGFTEGWWLPAAFDATTGAPLATSYAVRGNHYDQAPWLRANSYPGSAAYAYGNHQPATTLWFHDHTLGMTANNVYAGPAGFWLLRGDYVAADGTVVKEAPAVGSLPGSATPFGRPTHPKVVYNGKPGCDPNFDAACRASIREIPIALQDRSFKADGSLFYPATRAYFDGNQVVPYLPNASSDVAPIHNPEFFGNFTVVNGVVWPTLDVAPQRYRLRLLAGADSRTFNLSLWAIPPGAAAPNQNSPTYWSDLKAVPGVQEVAFYQIGAEQGMLPKVAKIKTGTAVALPGDGSVPPASCTPANAAAGIPASNPDDPACERGLLMAPGERADVIVDFSALPPGTKVRMINTGPDVPFNGFPIAAADLANPAGTGQVMEFHVIAAGAATPVDTSTPPAQLVLNSEPPNTAAVAATRRGALLEEDSKKLCVTVSPIGVITVVGPPQLSPQPNPRAYCQSLTDPVTGALYGAIPFGPTEVFVDSVTVTPAGAVLPQAQPWAAPITEAPIKGSSEIWETYNFTVDAHPMHLHGARFEVVDRQKLIFDAITGAATPTGPTTAAYPTEAGYKDVVVALPATVTRFKAKFEIAGLYVWHCHIVEHEDNEMMVPFCIRRSANETSCAGTPGGNPWPITNGGNGLVF